MIKAVVLYGHPTDTAAFDRYYRETHIPIAQKIPDVQKFEAGKVLGTPSGDKAPYYYQAELWFTSMEQLQASFASEGGRAATDDLPKFATGGVTIFIAEA